MTRSSYVRCLAGITLVWFAAIPLPAQTTDPVGEHAAKLFAQAQPHLEAVLGAKLLRPPQFQGVTVEQLRSQPDPELYAYLRWQFPHLEGDALQNALRVARYLVVSAAVAERAEGSEVIRVLPETQRQSIAGWDSDLKDVADPQFLQLALVHETVLWILEGEYDLPARRRATKDGEEYHALQALVEGRAQWLTWQVARRLDSTRYFSLLAKRFLHAPDIGTDGALRASSQRALRQRYWAWTQGLAFFAHLEQNGLKDVEKVVFARPPKQANAINRPELFVRALQSPRGDLTTALTKLQTAFPEAEWSVIQQPWTPDMVRQVAQLLGDRARVEKVLLGWDEGRSLVWLRKSNAAQHVALNAVRLQSKSAAALYFEFVAALQRKQDGGSTCGPSFRVLDSRSSAVRLPGADEAMRTDRRVELAPGLPAVAVSTWLVRAGDVVLECSWNGVPADGEWTGRILLEVLAEVAR